MCFIREIRFVRCTHTAGLPNPRFYLHRCAAANPHSGRGFCSNLPTMFAYFGDENACATCKITDGECFLFYIYLKLKLSSLGLNFMSLLDSDAVHIIKMTAGKYFSLNVI